MGRSRQNLPRKTVSARCRSAVVPLEARQAALARVELREAAPLRVTLVQEGISTALAAFVAARPQHPG